MSDRVEIVEVGPRDGLQNQAVPIPLADKRALIRALGMTGLGRIEVGAMVAPDRVPQMAGTDALLAALGETSWRQAVLVPNAKGYERLRAVLGRRRVEVAVFVAASEGFSRANLNCSIADSLARVRPVLRAAAADGHRLRGYVSTVTDCPYDGPVPPQAVARTVAALRAEMPTGVSLEVSLGETLGRARPEAVDAMLRAVLRVAPPEALAGHFHDTSGGALGNVDVALEHGLRVFDAAAGGLGGCPYAPGAAGNLATERLVAHLAERFETGVDVDMLAGAAMLARRLARPEPNALDAAGAGAAPSGLPVGGGRA
ncbi:MAG: hydroxymethylglutaryl-CoA lyase [Shimia sp.]